MAHLHLGTKTRTDFTPIEWLSIGRDIGTMANLWAGRSDIVAFVGRGAGQGVAPACFLPQSAELELDVEQAFGKATTPKMIGDLTDRKTQYEFPKAIGLIFHEACHAHTSQWSMEKASKELSKKEFDALMLLEESRIEKIGLDRKPELRNFLRSASMEIIVDQVTENEEQTSKVDSCANLVGLVSGRVIAGVLDEDDVYAITELVEKVLGKEIINKLKFILRNFQAYPSRTDIEPLYPLAKEWVKILEELKEERGEQDEEQGGSGSGSGMSELMEAIKEALENSSQTITISTSMELEDQEREEDWKEKAKASASESEQAKENKDVANEVFSKGTEDLISKTNSRVVDRRKPKPEERISAVTISKMLERAKYRDRDEVEISSEIPYGKLRTRTLVQANALKAKGVHTKVEPWKRTVRKHTEDPTLNVGVMVDISGSMSSAMQPMATTAWVMSEAVKRVQGRCAMVYYGNDVFPTLKAGESLPEVTVYTAGDSTEKFDKAFKALDGSLNLLRGQGARLLVVVSDGHYTPVEVRAVEKWVKACQRANVAVLWIPFDNGEKASELCRNTHAVVLGGMLDPTEASAQIGQACAKALNRASAD